ncbi:something about silencing, SAS, complex subunit 4-domain-containing protein [Ilyonectria robusta]|uniref:something about silencing, SAS, complex subunit 4-domain-containing protein n=1 Tax=Ilyonectria robusta TaxID=1079257 RepID=UPI001E8CFA06|nr:something about silencing, SAS, complex subunit 4-domain-containing protein [Ilyonectria robusta]KAH8734550.1 something about silencing, SAS, complex subunit 4-domain-containing protein [Ilyonectria robusta]
MASVTRSTRRAEGLHPHHHASAHAHHLTPSAAASAGLFHQAARNKRALEGPERDFDVIKPKRSRITVEILAKGSQNLADAVRAPPAPVSRPRLALATVNPPPPPTTTTTAAAPATNTDQNLTKHQAKVINGIKHELDRLQPQSKDTREQGRKLRSQEATRFKSELSAYFPEYDEVIGNDPKEHHVFNVETPIVVVDSDPRRAAANSQSAVQRPHQADQYPARGYGDALFNDVFDAQRIDFSFLEAQYKNKALEDPLPDKLFQPVHRRAERLERSIRNTEKGRAQHEKDQIIRLLEGLQGHDWLRIMGVSGITETKKKTFEPARDHFIKGCQAILAKFRNWILEERRRKMEKEKALAERAGEDDSDSAHAEEDGDDDNAANDDSSDSASPAKQLQEEAMARTKPPTKGSKKRRTTPQPPAAKQPAAKAPIPKPVKPPKPPEPPKEFKSFFSKRYERDGALNRHRRAGRKVMAWGHPVPEIPPVDFDLPEEFLDSDALKARERRKRRDRRGSKN